MGSRLAKQQSDSDGLVFDDENGRNRRGRRQSGDSSSANNKKNNNNNGLCHKLKLGRFFKASAHVADCRRRKQQQELDEQEQQEKGQEPQVCHRIVCDQSDICSTSISPSDRELGSLAMECRQIEIGKSVKKLRKNFDPRIIEKYEIIDLIGKGSFSRVVRVVHRVSSRQFAVKLVPAKNGSGPFENELAILARVKHPFVIRLMEMFRSSNRVYMVMELAGGGELYDRIVDKGTYTERESREAMRMVLTGLQYLHALGITHRDLKPENLLYIRNHPSSRLLITDFGLAHQQRYLSASGDVVAEETMTDTCGTPEYIAPEVLLRMAYTNKHVDETLQVDLWAVGVITYILLSGVMPFDDDNRTRLYRQIIRGRYIFYPEYWSRVSDYAKSFVASLLELEAEERLSADEALNHPWLLPPTNPYQQLSNWDDCDRSIVASSQKSNPPDLTVTITTRPPPNILALAATRSPPYHCWSPVEADSDRYKGPSWWTVGGDQPNAVERTRSTRSIRSVARSDHTHRVQPKEVEKLARDPEIRRLASDHSSRKQQRRGGRRRSRPQQQQQQNEHKHSNSAPSPPNEANKATTQRSKISSDYGTLNSAQSTKMYGLV